MGFAGEFDLISRVQLSTSPGFDRSVDLDLSSLNEDLGMAPGLGKAHHFQILVKLDDGDFHGFLLG